MSSSSERLFANTDDRLRIKLNDILAECMASGHRPVRNNKQWHSINDTLRARRHRNIRTPKDIRQIVDVINALPVAKTSADKKRENNDVRLRSDLKDILKYCHSVGHMPDQDSECFIKWENIRRVLYMRKRNGQPTPVDILDMMHEIQSLPTMYSFRAKEKKVIAAANIDSEKKLFSQRLEKLTRAFPRVKILRMMYGDAAFKRLVLSEFNPVATKIMSETLMRALDEEYIGIRNKRMLLEYIDGNADVYDMDAPDKLTVSNVANEYGLCTQRVRQLRIKTIGHLLNKIGSDANSGIFAAYVRGDVDGMIACMEPKWQKIYKFQRAHNLIGAVRICDLDGEHELDDTTTKDLCNAGAFINGAHKRHVYNNFVKRMAWVDENAPMLKFVEWAYGTAVYNHILTQINDTDTLTYLANYMTYIVNKCESKYRMWHKDALIKYVLNSVSASEREIIRKRYYSQPIPKSSIVHPDNIDDKSVRMNSSDLVNLYRGSLYWGLINTWMNVIISESKDMINTLLTMRAKDFVKTYKIPTDDATVAEFNMAGKWLAQNFGNIR